MGIKEQIEALTTEARAKCTHLIVSAAVRYWEDATVNGEADTEGWDWADQGLDAAQD